MLSSQQHAIAQLQQKHQRQLADLVQQLAAAEKRAKSSEAAHRKTKVCSLQSIGLSCMRVIICCPAAVWCTPVIGSMTGCARKSTSKTGMVFRHIMQLAWHQRQWSCVLQAELQSQRRIPTQFRKDVEYMDKHSRKADENFAQRE